MISTSRKFFNQSKKKRDGKNKGLFAEVHTVAPAPSRDYYALQLYQKKFLWTRWKISHGPYATPLQRVVSLKEFSNDLTMQNELTYIFGEDTTNLITDLANERWSLTSMPSNVLQKIFSYISVPDILRLSQVCKRLSKECSKNELWKVICKKQWKILIHNDIEKASLIGWKRVYLEKMRPKRYKTPLTRHPKHSILHRNRLGSVSTLNSPDSRTTTKSTYTIHKRIQELKQIDTIRSASEIFGKDFKTTSTSTGKSTDRTFSTRGKSFIRNDINSTGGGKITTSRSYTERKYHSAQSVINLVPLLENPRENESVRKNKPPRKTKCKVTSVRTRSVTSHSLKLLESSTNKFEKDSNRPKTGKFVKAK